MSGPLDDLVFFTDRDLGKSFPETLAAAGLKVVKHADLFPPDCPDETWLAKIGAEGWIAVTHDTRIRYKPNERRAVIDHGVRLLVVVGKAPYPELAENFVATAEKIAAFAADYPAPMDRKGLQTSTAPRRSRGEWFSLAGRQLIRSHPVYGATANHAGLLGSSLPELARCHSRPKLLPSQERWRQP